LIRRILVCLSLTFICVFAVAQKAASSCSSCAEWNRPQKPFRIFGNTYYVGPHGLSSILITSSDGDILIDGDLPESAKLIAENIRSLGFRVEDIKIILNSHVHFDHAGGIAELQRMTGARVMASPWSAAVLRNGGIGRDDPQNGIIQPLAPVKNVHELRDGQNLRLGGVSITAHFTPGHTPGGTSWTWKSCQGKVCRDIVFADSLAPMSAKGFEFSNRRDYPHALEDFEKSFRFLETTPCDILITTHPEASNLWDRLAAHENGATPDPMVNPLACKDLAKSARDGLRERLAEEHSSGAAK
jgi:metallo-beta-lactamase class B